MKNKVFDIEEELKKLPNKPGCYIMHDKNDNIIYVGKAINLKRRVTSYFRKTNKTQRILNMVALIDHFEYIVVDNEQEALILECNLIKKNMPKFNVLLKDDKTYPYIKINVKDDYPGVWITRKIMNDGARYFGPYASSTAANETAEFIRDKFLIRRCKNFKYKDRPCLNYHIKKCSAPCMGYVSKEEYRENIKQICSILDGNLNVVEKELKAKMQEASDKMQFEKAASYRDQLMAVESIAQRQKVSNISDNDIDVIGIGRLEDSKTICVQIFYIRNSKMIGRDNFFLKDMVDETDENIISDFIKQYYTGRTILPNKIMIRNDFEERELLQEYLSTVAERKVEIKIPQKGEKAKLVEMAENNARITLDNKEKANKNLVLELKQVLELDRLPSKIESYDISNISGEYMVSAMCVMMDGIIKKNLTRKFKIKTVFGQDDPRSMQETVSRRLRHSIKLEEIDEKHLSRLSDEVKEKYDYSSKKNGFGRLPDLILADGGITQIKAIKAAIKEIEKETGLDLNINVYGMVKNDKHQTRALIGEDRVEKEISEELFLLITRFQDTVHEAAIGYHKMLRDQSMSKSSLDDIKGIGEAKKKALLKQFGSVEKIKEASIEELTSIKGIDEELAKTIKNEL